MTLEEAIQDVLSRSELPLQAADIVKRVKPAIGSTATRKAVISALNALSTAGLLNHIGAGTPGNPRSLFTPHSLESAATAVLNHWVRGARKEQPAVKLKARLPIPLQPFFEAALSRLVAGGHAYLLPGGKRLVYPRQPKPSEMLTAVQRRALQKILHTVNSVRTQPATWEKMLAWLDAPPPASIIEKNVALPGEAELRTWYDLDCIRSSTMMIPIPQTYARYKVWAAERGELPDCQVLRSLMEKLYINGRLLLEPCERPQDLPVDERALLVPMSLGPPGYSWCWIS